MDIGLKSLLGIEDPQNYKVHFAVTNPEGMNPLTAFVANWEEWRGWNSWRGGCDGKPSSSKDDFSRERIFSLIRYAPAKWLFGGVFIVKSRAKNKRYELEDGDLGREFIGRLVVDYERPKNRGRAFNFEGHYAAMSVAEVLPKKYEGEAFPKIGNIAHRYSLLEKIFARDAEGWKAGLEMKGVYLITDRKEDRLYVGSATSETGGIWTRWKTYLMGEGDGGNVALKGVVTAKGKQYVRDNFYFAVLQVMPDAADGEVLEREEHWKNVLNTRDSRNYNRN